MYIKLDEQMDLYFTVQKPIYRGDNLARKIVYLIPMQVGEIDMLTAYVYLNFIRADGTPDVVVLDRLEEKYKESYYQYSLPVTCSITKYAGEVCTWIHIFSGSASNPKTAKSGECVLQIREAKDMDDYIGDRSLTALYQLHQKMTTEIEQMNTAITDGLASKADNISFNAEDSTIQLVSNGTPIGDRIKVSVNGSNVGITNIEINEAGEMIVTFDDGSEKNLGCVVGEDNVVYVPHVSAQKILTFTIENEPGEVPDPVDLNPHDEWSSIEEDEIETTYVWERM